MTRTTAGLALAFALAGARYAGPVQAGDVTANELESVVTMRLGGEITIDKDGEVLDYRIDDAMPPAVGKIVDESVRHWRFWPVEIQGKPVRARTRMLLTVRGTPVDGGYSIKIENTRFGEQMDDAKSDHETAKAASTEPTFEPRHKVIPVAPRNNLRGSVRVYLHIAPDGRVDHADAVQAALFNAKGDPGLLADALGEMIDNAQSAIRQWAYTVRTPDGKPFAGTTATMQVDYLTEKLPQRNPVTGARRLGRVTPDRSLFTATGSWRSEVRSAWRSPDWYNAEATDQRVGVSDAGGADSPAGLTSPFRLRGDSAERTL